MRVVCTSQNYHHLSIMRPEARGGPSPTTLPLFTARSATAYKAGSLLRYEGRLPYDNGMPNAVAGNLPSVKT